MITIFMLVLFVIDFIDSTDALPLYSIFKGGACSSGYEHITSTWQDCKAAAEWLDMKSDSISFVDSRFPATTAHQQGCYISNVTNLPHFPTAKVNDVVGGDRVICRLMKGASNVAQASGKLYLCRALLFVSIMP